MLKLWLVFIFTVVNVFALKQELINIPQHVQASILVYDYQHKKTLYQLMSNKLMNAASTVKLFTAIAVVDELGKNFKFEVNIHRDRQNYRLYITSKSRDLFTRKIEPYILEGFRYKLHI